MRNIIDQLNWRYATKKYNPNKKISKDDLEILKKSISLSPSSMGLQAYKVIIVENKNKRELLKKASYNQIQVTDSSHYFVFCAMKKIETNYVDTIVETTAKKRNISVENLNGYKEALITNVSNKDAYNLIKWNSKQCYIALGFLLETAAILNIDATPMEGFVTEEYNKILDLESKNLTATVACALGFRSEDDKYSKLAKSRKDLELLFETI